MAPRRNASPLFTPLPVRERPAADGGRCVTGAGRIRTAAREAECASSDASRRRTADAERRGPLDAIDRALWLLEESTAAGRYSPEMARAAAGIAEAATGRRIPGALLDRGTAAQLHDVLLGWQEVFLRGPAGDIVPAGICALARGQGR